MIPGVSKKMICSVALLCMPRTRLRVVCGFWLVIESFVPSSAFIKVDFPAFGTPTMAQ